MRRRLIVGGLTAAAAITALIAFPLAAGAVVNGGCTATGTATGSPGADITTQNVWHVRSDDVISGVGNAPTDQKHVTVDVVMFGLHASFKPLIDVTGTGSTSGHGGQYKVSDYSKYARVFYIGGSSDSCDGGILIVIDDVSAYATVAGGVGLGLTGLAVLALIGLGFIHGGRVRYVLGAVVGLLGGVGLGVFLEQTGTIDPSSRRTLAIPIAGLIAGLLLAGALAGEGRLPGASEPPGPTPPMPPAPAPPAGAAEA